MSVLYFAPLVKSDDDQAVQSALKLSFILTSGRMVCNFNDALNYGKGLDL